MAIVQTQCTVFKTNLLSGVENFAIGTPYTYKIALYNANASLDATTLVYTSDNEVVGSGYTAGGNALVALPPVGIDGTAYVSFEDVTWDPANFTCRGALIYNSTTGAAVAAINFGSDKTAITTFTVTFPTPTATTAILRLS
jgi:hypothetical protein